MNKLVYVLILFGLIAMSQPNQAQFKDWGTKFGARYNILLPQNEFPNVGFGENDKLSFMIIQCPGCLKALWDSN